MSAASRAREDHFTRADFMRARVTPYEGGRRGVRAREEAEARFVPTSGIVHTIPQETPCAECDGTGSIREFDGTEDQHQIELDCLACNGAGKTVQLRPFTVRSPLTVHGGNLRRAFEFVDCERFAPYAEPRALRADRGRAA